MRANISFERDENEEDIPILSIYQPKLELCISSNSESPTVLDSQMVLSSIYERLTEFEPNQIMLLPYKDYWYFYVHYENFNSSLDYYVGVAFPKSSELYKIHDIRNIAAQLKVFLTRIVDPYLKELFEHTKSIKDPLAFDAKGELRPATDSLAADAYKQLEKFIEPLVAELKTIATQLKAIFAEKSDTSLKDSLSEDVQASIDILDNRIIAPKSLLFELSIFDHAEGIIVIDPQFNSKDIENYRLEKNLDPGLYQKFEKEQILRLGLILEGTVGHEKINTGIQIYNTLFWSLNKSESFSCVLGCFYDSKGMRDTLIPFLFVYKVDLPIEFLRSHSKAITLIMEKITTLSLSENTDLAGTTPKVYDIDIYCENFPSIVEYITKIDDITQHKDIDEFKNMLSDIFSSLIEKYEVFADILFEYCAEKWLEFHLKHDKDTFNEILDDIKNLNSKDEAFGESEYFETFESEKY